MHQHSTLQASKQWPHAMQRRAVLRCAGTHLEQVQVDLGGNEVDEAANGADDEGSPRLHKSAGACRGRRAVGRRDGCCGGCTGGSGLWQVLRWQGSKAGGLHTTQPVPHSAPVMATRPARAPLPAMMRSHTTTPRVKYW